MQSGGYPATEQNMSTTGERHLMFSKAGSRLLVNETVHVKTTVHYSASGCDTASYSTVLIDKPFCRN